MPRVIRFEAVVGKPKNLNNGEIDSITSKTLMEIVILKSFVSAGLQQLRQAVAYPFNSPGILRLISPQFK